MCHMLCTASLPAHTKQMVHRLGSSVQDHVSPYVFTANGSAILSELRSKCANNSRITSTGEVCPERVQDVVNFTIFAGEDKVSPKRGGLAESTG